MEKSKDDFPKKIDSVIKSIIENDGLVNCEVDKRHINTEGGNYLGNLYEIDIIGKTENGNKKELNLFAKHVGEINQKQISVTDLYITELFAYKELFKIFEDLQEKFKVPIDQRYQTIKIYGKSDAELLIMENMAKKGFISYHRVEKPSLEIFETAVKQLAKFHGLSFVLREKLPEFFEEKIVSLKLPYIFNEHWNNLLKTLKAVSLYNIDDEYKERFSDIFDEMMNRYQKYCKNETIKKCLCHGDYRTCNLLIKFHMGLLQEMIPIDYQMIHYGCPVFDFLHLIFIGTDSEFRQAHLANLKELYYESLKDFLIYFKLDVNCLYPKEEFEKVYEEKLDYGLMCGLIFMPLVLASKTDLPDLQQTNMPFRCDSIFKDRLQDLIKDFVEWGFI